MLPELIYIVTNIILIVAWSISLTMIISLTSKLMKLRGIRERLKRKDDDK